MILSRQQSSSRFHAIEHDFKTEIGNAVVTTRAPLILRERRENHLLVSGERQIIRRKNRYLRAVPSATELIMLWAPLVYLVLGLMFWFTRKKLLGSYLFLIATSCS